MDTATEFLNLAKSGRTQQLGLSALPIRTAWNHGVAFPTEAFAVQGAEADRVFSWRPDVLERWGHGRADPFEFAMQEGAFNIVRTLGSANPGFAESQLVSFELPRDKMMFDQPPYLQEMSAAAIAATNGWYTGPHIDCGGGESLAKHFSGDKLWIITNELNAGRKLYSIMNFNQLATFFFQQHSDVSRDDRRFFAKLFYHVASPGDIILQPACCHCAIHSRRRAELFFGWRV